MDELQVWLGSEPLAPKAVVLPVNREVSVPRLLRHEKRLAVPIERCSSCWAPNKPALEFGGHTTWAELILVRLLERAGWEGRWLKNWTGGREPCVDVGVARPMPRQAEAFLRSIDARAGIPSGGGAWDVLAWRDDEFLCLESKQRGSSDKLRPTQLSWLDAAISEGLTRFAVVEYEAKAAEATRMSRATNLRRSSGISPRTQRRHTAPRPSTTRRTGVLDPSFAVVAPRGQGCEWLTKHGRPCQNPANYWVDGKWSCSRDHRA